MNLHTYQELIKRAARAHSKVQYLLDTKVMMPMSCDIDEVSLLFRGEDELEAFARWADKDPFVDRFNSVASDEMRRSDGVRFNVRFEFLRIGGAPWRIEAMAVLDGDAPLHEAALSDRGSGCVVHASYRAGTVPSEYTAELERLPEFGTLRAEYRNTYGQFSYWTVPEVGYIYLKPRVNLRDQK